MALPGGIQFYSYRDTRFKQGCLSFQLVRPMSAEEAAKNALIPAVLLRGCQSYRDLRAITLRLDDLYGASVSALVRRIGDYQTTGLYCSFMDDRFALPGDRVMEPMLSFLEEILLDYPVENGGFRRSFVESEKKNLISTIESELNDKRAYAMAQLFRAMCREDSYGVPRLGEKEQVAAITPRTLYGHQGMAYGACHGLFFDVEKQKGLVFLSSGVSEARRGVLSDVNADLIRLYLGE